MSLAGVHPLEMHGSNSSELINRSQSFGALSALSRSYGSLSSLEDVHQFLSHSEAVLSIEEIRLQLNSCFTCGVSWVEDHVSLDCSECGGYSLERPCPICEGQCNNIWKRDLTLTHASGKARWEGECGLERTQTRLLLQPLTISPDSEAQLCQRLENLKS